MVQRFITVDHPEKGTAYAHVQSKHVEPDEFYFAKARRYITRSLGDGFQWGTMKMRDSSAEVWP